MTPEEARVGARVTWADDKLPYRGWKGRVVRAGRLTADVVWDGDDDPSDPLVMPIRLSDLRLLPDEVQS